MAKRKSDTYVKALCDKNKLTNLLIGRYHGWTYMSLGIIHGMDHSSVYKACKIHGVLPPKKTISFSITELLELIGIKSKTTKNYKDYLDEAHKRKYPKLYQLR